MISVMIHIAYCNLGHVYSGLTTLRHLLYMVRCVCVTKEKDIGIGVTEQIRGVREKMAYLLTHLMFFC